MRFLSNTFNPLDPMADTYAIREIGQSQQEAVASWREWLKGKVVGRPQATFKYTVEQLESMGVVGIYDPEGEEQ